MEDISNDTDVKMIEYVRRENINYLDSIAMRYFGIPITYGDFFEQVNRYAKAIKQAGLNKGDYITICLPNTPEIIYYFYACNEIGVIPYLIDPRFSYGKIQECIVDSHSKLFICEVGTYYNKVAEKAEKLPVQAIIVVSPLNSIDIKTTIPIKLRVVKLLSDLREVIWQSKYSKTCKIVRHTEFINAGTGYSQEFKEPYDRNIPAIVVNTSGTSGESVKGAVFSNRAYNIHVKQAIIQHEEIRRGYSYFGYIPFFSMYGSSVGLHTALSCGIIIYIIPRFDDKSILELIDKRANILIGVPGLYKKLTSYCLDKKIDMQFAKLFVVGGDNISPEEFVKENEELALLGMQHKITYGYGLTEVMLVSSTTDDIRSYEYGSSGIPWPGIKIRILDHDTQRVLPYGKEGEIYVSTPTMMEGYLNKKEETDILFKEMDGVRYFRTGDKGFITETGHLFLTGRYKRMMKRPDGHQVSPIPIENAICNHPFVQDCCVVGLKKKNDDSGVIPTAFIKPYESKKITESVIKDIAKSALQQISGERESALCYVITDKIPYTENGKMDYRKLENSSFNSLSFYVVEDAITKTYFRGINNVTFINIKK